jgi:hypothetical protein
MSSTTRLIKRRRRLLRWAVEAAVTAAVAATAAADSEAVPAT